MRDARRKNIMGNKDINSNMIDFVSLHEKYN